MTVADAAYWMGFTRDLLAALAIIVGAFLALTLYARLRPRFLLRVLSEWVGTRLILRFEIENTSPVYANVKGAYFEVEERTLQQGGSLPHPVRFSRDETTRIFESTDRIYPGEIPAVERVYDFRADDVVVQVGFQVQLEARWRIPPWKGTRPEVATVGSGEGERRWWRPPWWVFPEHQQTTTRFVVKPPAEG